MPTAPGTIVTVTTAPPSPNSPAATGTWFVTGQTAQGPTGVAIPITSMTDYANYLGSRVSYGFLYDSLNEFFADGGVLAYVSRVVGPGASAAHITVADRGGSPQNTLTFTATGAGSWGDNVSIVVANGSVANSYTISIVNNGSPVLTTTNLFTPADAVNYFSALSPWVALVTVANQGSTNPSPTNIPANGTYTLSGGTDDTAGVGETQWTNALGAFLDSLGPGQVSAPGHTTTAGYTALANHALAFNRYALLDVADNATASSLVTQAQAVQAAATDASYAAIFGPWVVIPGINSSNPGNTSPVLYRAVPPSAVAAALMAKNDQVNDANTPAAGANGISQYAINVTQTYNSADLGTLNAAGVNVFRIVNTNTVLMGYRTLSLDPNWTYLNNARFRMQVVNDFGIIGDGFLFDQIDGQGQIFANFAGALAGRCQRYYQNGSLYGTTAQDAYAIVTGPQVNTAATIAAGQLNAQVLLKMSPFAEFVTINVIKYLANQPLPATTPTA